MIRTSKILAWGLTAMAAASLVAQPPGGGRGGFGRGGGGGAPGTAFTKMLESVDVQKELKFTADDKTAVPLLKDEIKKIDDAFAKEMEAARGDGGGGGDMKERFRVIGEKMSSKRKDVQKLVQEGLGEEKFKRFMQVYYQMQGFSGLQRDAEIAKKLDISEEQRDKIREMRTEAFQSSGIDFQAMRDMSETERADAMKKMAEATAKMEETVKKDVLTETQRKFLAELMGTPVTFKVDLFGGGGMGRGGAGGPGQGGGGNRGQGKGKGKGGDKGKEPPPAR